MQDEAPGNDPKKLWQNQATEPSSMTLLLVQKKTRELHRKTRGELLKSISGPLIAGLMGGFGIRFSDPVMQPVFGLAIIWSMAGMYFLYRGLWSAEIPEDTALSASLKSYRREVERMRTFFSLVLRWNLGPVLLVLAAGITLAVRKGILNRTTLPNSAPFLILLTLWLGAMVVIRIRQRLDLQREIEVLDEIERLNG